MKSTILIVDDDPASRSAIEAILEGQGYHLETTASGPEALEKAAALPPDLVLLDVMMPGMDGLEVCRRMRADPTLAEVPIIILTALDDHFFLLQGIEAGADDFLTKPVERQELRARAQTITRLNRYRTLLEQREKLHRLAERAVAAQEEERKRISRELHDDLGQALTAHMLSLRSLLDDLPLGLEDLRLRLDGLHAATIETLDKIRLLAQDLRPPLLDTFSLAAAVEIQCKEFNRRTHLPIVTVIDPAIGSVPDQDAIILYRVLQEALTNAARHAQASRIWVDLACEDDMLCLTVQDNGLGFQADASQSEGIGITGMRERLALADGQLVLRSNPGRGTILTAYLPLGNDTLLAEEAL